jgi:hypothetical protein
MTCTTLKGYPVPYLRFRVAVPGTSSRPLLFDFGGRGISNDGFFVFLESGRAF